MYGSLKQICRRKAATAIIKCYELNWDGMRTWHDFLKRYDNMGSADIKTLHYKAMLNKSYSSQYPGRLEQFTLDYEEAFTELKAIGETYTDAQKKCRILFNLYDTTPETQVITSWCKRHCNTFDDIVAHLTNTLIWVSHCNGCHAVCQAKQAHIISSVPDFSEDNDDFQTLLQVVCDQQWVPNDIKIPTRAWNLLPKEAHDAFIQEQAKLLPTQGPNSKSPPSNSILKQYGGISQQRHVNTTTIEPIPTAEAQEDSDTSTDDECKETLQEVSWLLCSHKATRDATPFLGMTITTPNHPTHRTVCVNVDPAQVRSLASRLSPCESIIVVDGGCDTGLLGADWYVLEYTNHYANVVGFDQFIARKSGLPIIIAVTKYILPDNKGAILLQHNKGVYNKDSQTTLFSEFQLRTRGCIMDITFKGHQGADSQPGTQCIVTLEDASGNSYGTPSWPSP